MLTPHPAPEILSLAIIDPRSMFRLGVKTAVSNLDATTFLWEAENYREWEEKSALHSTDILLLGVGQLSESDILTQLTRFRQLNPSGKMVLYDYRGALSSLLLFFNAHLNGYLREDFDTNDLQQCLKHLQTDRLYLDTELVLQLLKTESQLPLQPLPPPSKSASKQLSKMEGEVAGYLIQGMNVSKIAQVMERKTSTISTVKSNIQKKLQVDNIIDLAKVLR